MFGMTFSLAFALALLLTRPVTASADETCPVTATPLRTREAHAVHAFRVTSKKKMQAAADVAVDTDAGWFGVTFSRAGLWQVSFSRPLMIRNAWVENADGTHCYPPLPDEHVNVYDPSPPPARESFVTQAKIRDPYGRTDCASPFQNVRATSITLPDYRPGESTFPGTVVIDVVVMPDAKVGAANIVQSSGTPAFDEAALDAARKTAYAPAVAYCLPTVGRYSYKANVTP